MSDNTIEKDVRELLVSHFQLDDIADGEELSPDTVDK